MKSADSDTPQPSNRRSLSDQLPPDRIPASVPAERFQRLYAAIIAGQIDKEALACDDVQSLLDVYVADELAGQNVQQQYPEMWQHLQTCSNCRPDYEALLDVLRHSDDQSAATSSGQAFNPTFLRRPTEQEPWVKRVRSRLTGLTWGLEFVFDSKFLRDWLWPTSAAPQVRSGELPDLSADRVLLIDRAMLDDQQVLIELKLARSPARADHLNLSAELTSSGPLPDRLVSTLTLAGHLYTAPVKSDGRAVIENIPLDQLRQVLSAGQDPFSLAIEIRADDDSASG